MTPLFKYKNKFKQINEHEEKLTNQISVYQRNHLLKIRSARKTTPSLESHIQTFLEAFPNNNLEVNSGDRENSSSNISNKSDLLSSSDLVCDFILKNPPQEN